MKIPILNLIRVFSAVLSLIFFILLMLEDNGIFKISYLSFYVLMGAWLFANLILLCSILYKRKTMNIKIIRFLIYDLVISFFLYIILEYIAPNLLEVRIFEIISWIIVYTMLLSGFMLFVFYIDEHEVLLIGLTSAIPLGYIINRLGISEGEVVVYTAYILSSICFLILLFKTLLIKSENKIMKYIFAVSFGTIALLDILMILKAGSGRPAFNSTTDLIGVILFLITCLFIFMTLPFSNYIEWILKYKNMFKRLIVFPLIIFMFIFSLKFILPGNTYRKIFYREFSEKNVVYFNMKNYEIDFNKPK